MVVSDVIVVYFFCIAVAKLGPLANVVSRAILPSGWFGSVVVHYFVRHRSSEKSAASIELL